MFNEPVKLDFTSSGHYCVNILPAEESNELQCAEDEILTVDSNMSDGDNVELLLSCTNNLAMRLQIDLPSC